MSEPGLRPAEIAAAAVVIGGSLIVVWPQHGASLTRLIIATIAAAAGLYVFTVLAPPAWWTSPFDARPGRGRRRGRSVDDVDWIRALMAGRRQPIENGPPLPPGMLRLLQPLIRSALEREGLDPVERGLHGPTRTAPAPLMRAVLAAEPLRHAPWFRTRRPDPRSVAAIVDDVLDDLDRIRTGRRGAQPEPPTGKMDTA